jgi:hypothetical protein
MQAQTINVVGAGKAFVSQSDDGIKEATHREKWWTVLKATGITIFNEDSRGITGIENGSDEIKAILEEGIDNLGF